MSKRVHEIAKELNKSNKEVITFLAGKHIEVKSHMSMVEDDQIAMLREAFAGTGAEQAKAAEEAPAPAKKKSKIIAVYNPQNSQDKSRSRQGQNKNKQNPATKAQQRPQNAAPKADPAKAEPVKAEAPKPAAPVKEAPVKTEPAKAAEQKKQEPIKTAAAAVKAEPTKTEPVKQAQPKAPAQDSRKEHKNDSRNENRNQKQAGGKDQRQNQNSRPQNDRPKHAQPAKPDFVPAKPENRKQENKKADNRGNDRNRSNEEKKEKGKQAQNGRGNRPNQGGNRPNQKNGKNNRQNPAVRQAPPAPKKEDLEPKVIELPEMISIHDLAEKMKIQPSAIIKKLFLAGKMVTVNSELDFEAAGELALEYNFDPVPEEKEDVIAKMLEDVEDGEDTLVARPPVVCVMGHVDHGKTSLLDAIRDTRVIDREAGGITQHIGAYMVDVNGQKITFLDTPGHEAFTSMRMRGANSTDIAILVVAADDGVMPQTVEAISHAKAAGVEIIVAINKIDKPSANVERVKQELTEYELIPEDWGGSTVFVPVSAHTHEGIEDLLEMILLTADVLELKSNPNRKARGLVIEAQLDKGKGPVATVLVQKGTLHVGDPITVGSCYGKVRAMMDDQGRRVKEAGPSQPVEILGLSDVPGAGDIFLSPSSDKEARSMAETFIKESREKLIEDTKLKMSLDDLYSQIQSGSLKELNIIVKADVQGSVEAVKQSLLKLSNDEVVVKIIHGGVGSINESDVSLASASNAIIIGFNVRPDATAKEIADREKIDLRLYRVIYDAINDVQAAMKGMLDPIFEEKVLGHAEVRQIFKASGVGTIAGSYVLDGMFQRGCSVRITREGTQIFEGALASLKRFKDDVKEVKAGYECGLVFEKFNDLQELDIVEAYTMVEVPR